MMRIFVDTVIFVDILKDKLRSISEK